MWNWYFQSTSWDSLNKAADGLVSSAFLTTRLELNKTFRAKVINLSAPSELNAELPRVKPDPVLPSHERVGSGLQVKGEMLPLAEEYPGILFMGNGEKKAARSSVADRGQRLPRLPRGVLE